MPKHFLHFGVLFNIRSSEEQFHGLGQEGMLADCGDWRIGQVYIMSQSGANQQRGSSPIFLGQVIPNGFCVTDGVKNRVVCSGGDEEPGFWATSPKGDQGLVPGAGDPVEVGFIPTSPRDDLLAQLGQLGEVVAKQGHYQIVVDARNGYFVLVPCVKYLDYRGQQEKKLLRDLRQSKWYL